MKIKTMLVTSTVLISLIVSPTPPVYAAQRQHSVDAASIVVNGHVVLASVPYIVRKHTVWMPAAQLVTALKAMTSNVNFDGHVLRINNLASQSSTLGVGSSHTIAITNGATTLFQVPTRRSGTNAQTYLPVWYLMKALTQGMSGYRAAWKPGQLRLVNNAAGAPSTQYIERVMQNTTESDLPSEHFILSGKPVQFTFANGDTITAAIGMRYPTADGYGQEVFFFHNHQFIGLDSNVEKSEIRSITVDPNGTATFDVTYTNYAPSDPMVHPSLPPVTVKYGWNGSNIIRQGSANIPNGSTNNIQVDMNGAYTATADLSKNIPDVVKKLIQSKLPNDAQLTDRSGTSTPYLAVDLNGDGHTSYAAVYSNPTTHAASLIVASLVKYQWQVVWNKPLVGTKLRQFSAGDMTGDGSQDIAVQTYVGDGANDVLILKLISGKIQCIFNMAGTADIGDFNQDGMMEVANWIHDTGPLENIQIYAWDSKSQTYAKANNHDFPQYFANVVVPYYQLVERDETTGSVPAKMLDYGLATSYDSAGLYKQTLSSAKLAVAQGSNAYPSDQKVQSVLDHANTGLAGIQAYAQLPSTAKSAMIPLTAVGLLTLCDIFK